MARQSLTQLKTTARKAKAVAEDDVVVLDAKKARQQRKAVSRETDPLDEFDANLAEHLDAEQLSDLASRYFRLVKLDMDDRNLATERFAESIKNSGLSKQTPGPAMPGGADVVHPILTESSIDFQSAMIEEIFPPDGPVKVSVSNYAPRPVLNKANAKAEFLNRQLMFHIPEYRAEMEKMLPQIPLAGCGYMKHWWSTRFQRPSCELISRDRVGFPYSATSFYTASRIWLLDNLPGAEFRRRVRNGLYAHVEAGDDSAIPKNNNNKFDTEVKDLLDEVEGKESSGAKSEMGIRKIIEIYCDLDLSDDPLYDPKIGAAPYIMTLDRQTQKIVALYRNWAEKDTQFLRKDYLVQFPFIPWMGADAIGLTQIAGPLARVLTAMLRAMLDNMAYAASTTMLQRTNPGIKGQTIELEPGLLIPIEMPLNQKLSDSLMAVPFNQIPPQMINLYGMLETTVKGILRTSLDEIGTDDSTVPVGTQMQRVEQGLKTFKAVFARFHEAQRRQLDIFCRLYNENLTEDITAKDENGKTMMDSDGKPVVKLTPEDFANSSDLRPVTDPAVFSETLRMSKWMAVSQMAQQQPQLFDIDTLFRCQLERWNFPNVAAIMPSKAPAPNDNPVTENVKMLSGQLPTALPDQDHQAHLASHFMFFSSKIFGEDPATRKQILPYFLPHVRQHVNFLYADIANTALTKAMGKDMSKINARDPKQADEISKQLAQLQPQILQELMAIIGPFLPELAQLQQELTAMQQPPPPQADPSTQLLVNAQLKKDQNDVVVKNAEVQLKSSKQQTDQQHKDGQLLLKAEELRQEGAQKTLDTFVQIAQIEAQAPVIPPDILAQLQAGNNNYGLASGPQSPV